MVFDSARCPLSPEFAALANCISVGEREIRCEAMFGMKWSELARKAEIDQFFDLVGGDRAYNLTAIQWPSVSADGTVGPVTFRFRYEKLAPNTHAFSSAKWPYAMPSFLDSVGEGEIAFGPGEWDDRLDELARKWCKYAYGAFDENTADVEISTVNRIRVSLCA